MQFQSKELSNITFVYPTQATQDYSVNSGLLSVCMPVNSHYTTQTLLNIGWQVSCIADRRPVIITLNQDTLLTYYYDLSEMGCMTHHLRHGHAPMTAFVTAVIIRLDVHSKTHSLHICIVSGSM